MSENESDITDMQGEHLFATRTFFTENLQQVYLPRACFTWILVAVSVNN